MCVLRSVVGYRVKATPTGTGYYFVCSGVEDEGDDAHGVRLALKLLSRHSSALERNVWCCAELCLWEGGPVFCLVCHQGGLSVSLGAPSSTRAQPQ